MFLGDDIEYDQSMFSDDRKKIVDEKYFKNLSHLNKETYIEGAGSSLDDLFHKNDTLDDIFGKGIDILQPKIPSYNVLNLMKNKPYETDKIKSQEGMNSKRKDVDLKTFLNEQKNKRVEDFEKYKIDKKSELDKSLINSNFNIYEKKRDELKNMLSTLTDPKERIQILEAIKNLK